MPEWLQQTLHTGESSISLEHLVVRLVLSFVLGCVVAGVYILTHRNKPRAEVAPLVATLVLLTILITMVTLVINDNVARAFSLVGALAIVRFRTVVEDTRDTAFVIFAVVVGMAVGVGYSLVPVVGIPIVAAASLMLSAWAQAGLPPSHGHVINLRLGIGRDPESLLKDIFAKHASRVQLTSTATARQGAAIDLIYHVILRDPNQVVAFVVDLNRVEGIQNVEVRQGT